MILCTLTILVFCSVLLVSCTLYASWLHVAVTNPKALAALVTAHILPLIFM